MRSVKLHAAIISVSALVVVGCGSQSTEITSTASSTITPEPTTTPVPTLVQQSPLVGSLGETEQAFEDGIPFLSHLDPEPDMEITGEAQLTTSFSVSLDNTTSPTLWGWNWCAIDQLTLTDNIAHIDLSFTLNGEAVSADQIMHYEHTEHGISCIQYATLLTDWPLGTHAMELLVTFEGTVNDGWDDYWGSLVYLYAVQVGMLA